MPVGCAADKECIGDLGFPALNYAVGVSYLTLKTSEKQIRDPRSGEVWAEIAPFSIAEATDPLAREAQWGGETHISRLVVSPGGEGESGEDDIARSFLAWSGSGKEVLDSGMRVLVEVCRDRNCELLIWPRVGSLVSDIPGLLAICRKQEDVGIFLEPAALFPGGEHVRREDFVERLIEVVPLPGVRAFCFGTEDVDVDALAPLAHLAAELKKPVVLRGESPERAAEILGLLSG